MFLLEIESIFVSAAACNTGILREHWFETWMLHFQGSSLCLGKRWEAAEVFGPCHLREAQMKLQVPAFSLAL